MLFFPVINRLIFNSLKLSAVPIQKILLHVMVLSIRTVHQHKAKASAALSMYSHLSVLSNASK